MYLLGEINGGGFIFVRSGASKSMLHKETRGLHHAYPCILTLSDAKERLKDFRASTYEFFGAPKQNGPCNPLIIKLTPQGGAERLYAKAEDREVVTERLQVWKGCYGAWPVTFQGEK